MVVYYYCKECPFKTDCTKQSWKKAQVSTDSKEEAVAALKRHLMQSSLHLLDENSAQIFAADADYGTYEDDEPPHKKHKAEEEGTSKSKNKISAVVAETIRQMSEGTSSSSSAATLVPRPHSADGASAASAASNTVVSLRKGQLQQAIDCVARAATAAKQAQRLAASAARAFADEALALESCKASLENTGLDFL